MELAVTALAAVFAMVTGLGYGYDATFGSSWQYIRQVAQLPTR